MQFSLIFEFEFISAAARRAMSIESDEGDVEDNRAGSITSSRSNMSEVCIFQLFQIISDVFGFTDYITSFRVTQCSKRRIK